MNETAAFMPTPHVLLDHQLVSADAAKISATSEGFLYGHGVFETIKILGGRPVFFAQHHARLLASAQALDLVPVPDLAELHERLLRVIHANDIADGSAKIVLFNNGPTTGELITTKPGLYPAADYTRGFHLKTNFTGERTGALTAHKSINYLRNIRAKRAAISAGYDEALFFTPAGIVIEGATTNLFAVRGGLAYTPPLAAGPLPGIARATVIDLLGPDRVREMLLTTSDLQHADELFVTNALLGVMPVSRLDDRVLDLAKAPFTKDLLAAYRAREQASLS